MTPPPPPGDTTAQVIIILSSLPGCPNTIIIIIIVNGPGGGGTKYYVTPATHTLSLPGTHACSHRHELPATYLAMMVQVLSSGVGAYSQVHVLCLVSGEPACEEAPAKCDSININPP